MPYIVSSFQGYEATEQKVLKESKIVRLAQITVTQDLEYPGLMLQEPGVVRGASSGFDPTTFAFKYCCLYCHIWTLP